MKHIKLFESWLNEWSPNFNRTLQGAAAIATSTNKPFQKKQSIEDYANRSISKEEFSIVPMRGDDVVEAKAIFANDPKFILKPIEQFYSVNSVGNQVWLSIPIIQKSLERENGSITNMTGENSLKMLTFTEKGLVYFTPRMQKWDGSGGCVKFLDRASLENFMAMAIQAITSSPEPGTPVESASERILNRRNNIPDSGMTEEKQSILDLIQKIVLDKDKRSFTI